MKAERQRHVACAAVVEAVVQWGIQNPVVEARGQARVDGGDEAQMITIGKVANCHDAQRNQDDNGGDAGREVEQGKQAAVAQQERRWRAFAFNGRQNSVCCRGHLDVSLDYLAHKRS